MINKELRNKGVKKTKRVLGKPYMVRFKNLEKKVYNSKGENLGKIEDVILDLTSRRIAFGILSFGGIFGLGDKHYAIPWEMLRYNQKKEQFILDIDKEKLLNAESFTPNNYTYTPYGPWAPGVYGYWGYRPYWK